VQKLSNQSLQQYYATHIFQPMGLTETFYDPYTWEFLVPSNGVQEYFFYTTLPFPPSENPDSSSGAYPPFAIGACDNVEFDPGFQAGSGGITSTLPDMVKWYTSLFIKQNTTILSKESIRLLLYPWAITNNYPQYYGLGTELMYSVNYWEPIYLIGSFNFSLSFLLGLYLRGSRHRDSNILDSSSKQQFSLFYKL
jgi:CubicO group peptidase (beta-lactamase class C family)